MARAGRLTAGMVIVAVVAAHAASAAGPCEEGRAQTGLALALAADGLAVAAVDAGSAAAESGFQAGDTVVQVNGAVPRSCGDYARVVREARRERKAVLVLVRRAAGEVPFALTARTWDRPVAVVEAPAPAEAPSVQAVVATPPPPPLPRETEVTLAEVTHGLEALAPATRPPAWLAAYQSDLLLLRRQTETLAARGTVPPEVVSGLRTVLSYYDAASVAWESEEQLLQGERRPRHLPASEAAAAPYFADSPVATAVDEFPFLREVVVRDPAPGPLGSESSGLWRPGAARTLLWERGRAELARLTTWLRSRSKTSSRIESERVALRSGKSAAPASPRPARRSPRPPGSVLAVRSDPR